MNTALLDPEKGSRAETRAARLGKPVRDLAGRYKTLGVFAALLAITTLRHEMWLDETQAWVIVRDSRNFLDVLHQLHYEGHAGLWYLLIFFPAHLFRSMVWMQGINYVLAVSMAWLVLREERMDSTLRVLVLFSFPVFFAMGSVSRDYVLSDILLLAASRCLRLEQPRHWLAMGLLALAINSHFLAIPIALSIFVWMYWLYPEQSWSVIKGKLKQWQFWLSLAILASALMACYFTLRPASDLYTPHYQHAGVTRFGYLILGIGRVWHYFFPIPLNMLPETVQELLVPWEHPSWLAMCLTICLWLLVVSALSTARSRWFMLSTPPLWMAGVWATVHVPTIFHATFISVIFVIALTLDTPRGKEDTPGRKERGWGPRFAPHVLVTVLAVQTIMCAFAICSEWSQPFSGEKATAEWLKSAGLTTRPLVIQPDLIGPAILGYSGIRSAYYPACQCSGSFVILNRHRDPNRQVTPEELRELRNRSRVAAVVISRSELPEDMLKRLGLRLVYVPPHNWFWARETIFVYDSANPSG